MAARVLHLLHLLLLLLLGLTQQQTGNGDLATLNLAIMSQETPRGPHFTGCLSREQETFRCWWSAGSYQNLTEPGALRVFYLKKNSLPGDWKECPDYTASVPNECYFNKTYTSIWISYCVQLRSRAQNVTYDELCFTVENIVYPDAPVGLNWTLLNVSRSGLHFDAMVRWEPPPSADVKAGWMSLVYEVHYREVNATYWNKLKLETGTQQSIYGLHTDREYEVRVRCRMTSFDNFGVFSDSIFIFAPHIPTKESTFPLSVFFIFATVGVAILLMLVAFSQQQKLMVILLPPVPAPKIKGIDPELLKKGRLEDLSAILSSHHVYKPEPCGEDPWVEFIELDLDEPEAEADEKSDTQRLLGPESCSHTLGAKDDDSGRASCYDPEPPAQDTVASEQLPVRGSSPAPAALVDRPLVRTQISPQSWVNTDFYAQVSDVRPAGGVVLCPGQQGRALESSQQDKKEDKEEDKELKKEKGKGEVLQVLIVAPDGGAYTSERDARQISSDFSPHEEGYGGPLAQLPLTPAESKSAPGGLSPVGGYQSPYLLAPLPPVSDYTVVQNVDIQHSLLLNPTKAPPPPPAGYLTPDLMGNFTL